MARRSSSVRSAYRFCFGPADAPEPGGSPGCDLQTPLADGGSGLHPVPFLLRAPKTREYVQSSPACRSSTSIGQPLSRCPVTVKYLAWSNISTLPVSYFLVH